MLKKLKDMLGIEGVKIDVLLPESIDLKEGLLKGQILLNSQSDQIVQHIEIKLIEKYKRGRKESLLIDEYLLGSMTIDLDLQIIAGKEEVLNFQLPYNKMMSEMDRMEDDNPIKGLFVKLAKTVKGVQSDYRVEATATTKGTKLNPIIVKRIGE